MNKLSRDQLSRVVRHIQQADPHPALHAELIDHMATLIERRMSQGQAFTAVFDELVQHTSSQAMQGLSQRYEQTFTPPGISFRRRAERRPATRPFHYMFLSCGLTFLLLMGGFLLIARPMALPSGVFHPVWTIGLVGVSAVGLARWWLKRRSPNVLAKG